MGENDSVCVYMYVCVFECSYTLAVVAGGGAGLGELGLGLRALCVSGVGIGGDGVVTL